jgi:hypothetical protein
MLELDWEGIANLLDKWPEGMLIGGEAKVSIPNTDICKIEFVSMKQDGNYYYIVTDVISVEDIVNSVVRVKLTNMLLDIMADEFNSLQTNTPVDYSKEKEAIAKVIKLLDDLDKK